jgi:hypothetical protein
VLLILADKLNVSRVELFQRAGWLNSSNDEMTMSLFREPIASNKLFLIDDKIYIILSCAFRSAYAQTIIRNRYTNPEIKNECEKVNYG